jgi:phosphopantetheinyl transferase
MKSTILEKIPEYFSASAIPYAPPGEDEAVIVIANKDDIKALKLPPDELWRAEKITHFESRNRYLAGRYILRSILSQWSGLNPENIQLALNSAGKPYFLQTNMPCFSLSHTDDVIAVVFASKPVGIDVERERELDIPALSRRFFSQVEADFLASSNSVGDFFRLWCCREAAIKGDGRGLAALLGSTTAEFSDSTGEGDILVVIEDAVWRAIPWKLRGAMHGAVAFQHVPSVIRWCDLR